jgi:hypothetical protein
MTTNRRDEIIDHIEELKSRLEHWRREPLMLEVVRDIGTRAMFSKGSIKSKSAFFLTAEARNASRVVAQPLYQESLRDSARVIFSKAPGLSRRDIIKSGCATRG